MTKNSKNCLKIYERNVHIFFRNRKLCKVILEIIRTTLRINIQYVTYWNPRGHYFTESHKNRYCFSTCWFWPVGYRSPGGIWITILNISKITKLIGQIKTPDVSRLKYYLQGHQRSTTDESSVIFFWISDRN